jgi:hypothetical protein
MMRMAAGLLIALGLLASSGLAQVTGPGGPPAAGTDDEAEGEDAGSFKLCSAVFQAGRDTIPVPEGWTAEDCRQWVSSVGGRAQIGCVFALGSPKFSWAPAGNAEAVPEPDCGWAEDVDRPR